MNMESASYPFNDDGAAVPPVCLKTHWDPTAISRHYTLPDAMVSVPLPFRPATQVCRQYVTSAPVEQLPGTLTTLPLRSDVSPPDRYSRAIDSESQLRRLDRPLGIAEGAQYVPNLSANASLFSQRMYVASRAPNMNSISELEFPRVLMRADGQSAGYACREADYGKEHAREKVLLEKGRMFNYATKYTKYNA